MRAFYFKDAYFNNSSYRPFIDQIAYKLHAAKKKRLGKEFLEIYSHFGSTKAPKKWPKSQDFIQFF